MQIPLSPALWWVLALATLVVALVALTPLLVDVRDRFTALISVTFLFALGPYTLGADRAVHVMPRLALFVFLPFALATLGNRKGLRERSRRREAQGRFGAKVAVPRRVSRQLAASFAVSGALVWWLSGGDPLALSG
ncbi:hypothetical protein OG590_15000 [Streptomyces goshikiensis]|uniref:hypothetical protein n=1 Tax=Streptomyces goshikiensis TaxID=1942 RepID=UPI0036A67292|nr:hypothetical protein OG590_15000 [Streptomyces goshikiensis]